MLLVKRNLQRFLVLLVALVSVIAPGATVVLKGDTKVHLIKNGDQERVGLLSAGSEVEIPDYFVKRDSNGKASWDLTLQNWLSSQNSNSTDNDKVASHYRFDGERTDYFYPIKVKKVMQGSSAKEGEEYFVRLNYLANKGEALFVDQDAPAIAMPSAELDRQTEVAKTNCDTCSKEGPVERLRAQLNLPLVEAEKGRLSKTARIAKDEKLIPGIFKKSCGINYDSFANEIKKRLAPDSIRADIFIRKINLEASGRCYIINSESDQSGSVGLFQINSRGAKYPRCSDEQRAQIVGAKIEELKKNPMCLENPLINFEEALRIYRLKERVLFSKTESPTSEKEKADRERIIVAAYNGGESYVIDARQALTSFNQKNGTQLNPNNWEDLRPFFFRQALKVSDDEDLIGDKYKFKRRKKELLISNIAHSETLVPLL